MHILYLVFIVMLTVAIGLIAIPLRQQKLKLFLTTIFLAIFTFGIYQFTGNKAGLKQWLAQGKQHYQLQEQFNQLGGVQGAIDKIQKKLESNPRDVKGWLILGKLYLSIQDDASAQAAFNNAYSLQPENQEIKQYKDRYAKPIN